MTLNEICQMTTNPEFLNTLHACREGHPWNTLDANHWHSAWFLACQQPIAKFRKETTHG